MTPESKLAETSFGTFVTETRKHFLKTNSGGFVPFDDVAAIIAQERLKAFQVHQLSKENVREICLPQYKLGDDCSIYFEKLEQFFIANSVKDEVRKISFLISTIGQEAYEILRDLCEPVLPSHYKTYDELREIVRKNYEAGFFEENPIIEKLPQDCLILIFNNLPPADRTRIERVNTKFQEAAKLSWSNLKELSIDPVFLGLKPFGVKHEYDLVREISLRKILRRCGRYLKKIDLSYMYKCLLSVVSKYCLNIESIKCFSASENGIRKLRDKCKQICELIIEGRVQNEDTLGELFSESRNLRVLDVQNYYVSGKCLLKLPLEEMIVLRLPGCETPILSETIRKTKQLSEFSAFIRSSSIISDLASSCSNLTVIDLSRNDKFIFENLDLHFSLLFKNNRNLKSFKLYAFDLTGECFLSLNKNSIEEIFLEQVDIKGVYLIKCLPQFVKLHTLYLDGYFYENNTSDQVFESIGLCSKLKNLTLSDFDASSYDSLKKAFSLSKNIESLKIKSVFQKTFEVGLLSFIGSSLLNLKYLSIDYREMTDKDLESICDLPNLEELSIKELQEITGSVLVKFFKLKKLHCKYCNLETDNIISFMRYAKNLELLDIRYCEKLGNSVINAAIEITKKRKNNVTLTIWIDKEQIDFEKIDGKSSLLYLNCNRHCREDYVDGYGCSCCFNKSI